MRSTPRWRRLGALACAAALVLSLVPGTAAAAGPAQSRNIHKNDYTTWSRPVTSYLYGHNGGLTRVEYTGGQIVVEDYDSSFALQSSRTVPMELSLWGGFFAGEDYNFLIFGQSNPSESDSAEVIRVVKYDKDWNRLGQASLRGANTVIPFDAGSLRCDEYGGYLYLRTSHEMYTSDDGLNHQSNLTMAVRQSDMSITDSYYDVMNISYGYVSHSFNQFILVDSQGRLAIISKEDLAVPASVATVGANPRAVTTRSPAHTLITHSTSSAAAAYTPLRSPTPVSITPQIMPPSADSPAPRAISAAAIAKPKGAYPPNTVPRASTAQMINRCTPLTSVCRCSSFQSCAAHAAARPSSRGAARLVFCLSIFVMPPLFSQYIPNNLRALPENNRGNSVFANFIRRKTVPRGTAAQCGCRIPCKNVNPVIRPVQNTAIQRRPASV